MYDLTGCVFIKDTFKGAFCLFESMYQLMPLCDEFIVMDLGSTDGTLETLKEIEAANPKLKIVYGSLYKNDASIFANLANEIVSMANHSHVLYYQADEIWHEDLIGLTRQALDKGERNLSFWRYQLKHNFQKIKWFPHPVHRIGAKGDLFYTNDGMNTDKVFDTHMVSSWHYAVKNSEGEFVIDYYSEDDAKNYIADYALSNHHIIYEQKYDLGHFTQWGDRYKHISYLLPTNEMILDVSLTGAFLDNIPDRRRMHLPFWNEADVMPADEDGLGVDAWYNSQSNNSVWTLDTSQFNIPAIMRYHLGKKKYILRPKLLEDLKTWR